jgi:predicted KAP-like P-loop ATPase
MLSAWRPDTADNPIEDWEKDAIGRNGIVDLLVRHIFLLHTPVIALQGAYGNGKSSTLGLLKKSLEREAIVVEFNAWLPNSNESLIDALFHDVAVSVGRRYYIPRLRTRLRSYARMIGGAVSSLGILKEMLSPNSQADGIVELKVVLGSLPVPVIVFLDEIDRMQSDDQRVILKALRGASSLPNVTFICAFDHTTFRDSNS